MPMQINKIPLREAETNSEKRLLGLLAKEAEEINYGKFTLELTVSGGKVVGISIEKIKTNVKL